MHTGRAFTNICRKVGVLLSMSAIGSSADSTLAEPLNTTFKRETHQSLKS